MIDTPKLPQTGLAKLQEMIAENLEHAPGRAYMLEAMKQMVAEHEAVIQQRDKALRIARDALRCNGKPNPQEAT